MHDVLPAEAPPEFAVLSRAEWSALPHPPGRSRPPDGSPITQAEWDVAYLPLARMLGAHIDSNRLRRDLLDLGAGLDLGARPFVIGLTGSVAAGKSTFARALAALLEALPERPRVAVVSTDGFLFTNAELMDRGLLARKGFPDSYDTGHLTAVLGALAAGRGDVHIPVYSHVVYDVVDTAVLDHPDVVILEGVNTLAPGTPALAREPKDFCHVTIYLDAAEPDVRSWFVARFHDLVAEARDDPTSFFHQWVGMAPADVAGLAQAVWEGVNLVNLEQHILPTRWRADLVVRKGADHAITEVAIKRS